MPTTQAATLILPTIDEVALIVKQHANADLSDLWQWVLKDSAGNEKTVGRLTHDGYLLFGENPSFLNTADSQRWVSHNVIHQMARLGAKGSGRSWFRNITLDMTNDLADLGGRRSQGTPSGNIIDIWTTGTVNVTNGSPNVTQASGSTDWTHHVLADGMYFRVGTGPLYKIQAVVSDTQLTLATPYGETTATGVAYEAAYPHAGTADVVAGSLSVQGHNTFWLKSELINKSFRLASGGPLYQIGDVDEVNQILILTDAYDEDTAASVAYKTGFNGFPFGKNNDGTQLYPCENGTALFNVGGTPLLPTGNYDGYASRQNFATDETPYNFNGQVTIATTWHSGDTELIVAENPANVQNVANGGVDNQGVALPPGPCRDNGVIILQLDTTGTQTKTTAIQYAAYVWDGTHGIFLGCTDTSGGGRTAAPGKTGSHQRHFRSGKITGGSAYKGARTGNTLFTVHGDGSWELGPPAVEEGTGLNFFRLKGGGLRLIKIDDIATGAYSFKGTAPGTRRRNYYVIPFNELGERGAKLKINVPNGIATYSNSAYLLGTFSTPKGWTKADVVYVDAEADGTDTIGASYTSLAEGMSLLHDSTGRLVGTFVDRGQIINPNYDMRRDRGGIRNETADARVGRLILDGGFAPPIRTIGTTGDGRVPGQDITVDGNDHTISVNTSLAPRHVYLPSVASVPGRIVRIKDRSNNARANPITFHPYGSDTLPVTVIANNGGWAELQAETAGLWQLVDIGSMDLPQGPSDIDLSVVAPGLPVFDGVVETVTNRIDLCRVVVGETGVLHDLAVFVGNPSGNARGVIYSGDLATKLWTGASTPLTATRDYQVLGDPVLAVKAGDVLYLARQADNALASFGYRRVGAGLSNAAKLPSSWASRITGALHLGGLNQPGSFTAPAGPLTVTPAGLQFWTGAVVG